MALKFYENYEIYIKKTKFNVDLTSSLKESVRKWTGDHKKTGKQTGEPEGREKGWGKFRRMGLTPSPTKIPRYVTARQTDRQTDRQTKLTDHITVTSSRRLSPV